MAFQSFDPNDSKRYPAFTLYPFYHKAEKMRWASACVVHLADTKNLIFCSGETGRDPETDRQPRNFDEERARVGVVFDGIKAQTKGSWTRLKEILVANHGDVPARLTITEPDVFETVIALPETLKVNPTDDLLVRVERLFGEKVVRLA